MFAFLYTPERGGVLRVRSSSAGNSSWIAAGSSKPYTESTHLPALSSNDGKWKFVVALISCTVAGHEWQLHDARKSAEAALGSSR